MKRLILATAAAAIAVSGCAAPAQKSKPEITHIFTEGNLQSLKTVGCVNVSELTNQHTPADIYPGVRKCINAGNFERAGQLFFVAAVYGHFDTLRTADKTAHQATKVLRINNLNDIDEESRRAFGEFINDLSGPGSTKLAALCEELRRLGPPAYYPTYMLQHGLSAIAGEGGGLEKDFNPSEAWASILDSYGHCDPQAIAQTRPTQPSSTANVLNILRGLPQPTNAPANRPAVFSPNAYGQQSLNFQRKSTPEAAVQFYRQALGRLGYTEETALTTIGQWGFSIVFDPPAALVFAPRRVCSQFRGKDISSSSVVLILQGVMLSPDTINTNIRFEEKCY